MKIWAVYSWDEHEGLFNEHTIDSYHTTKEGAEKAMNETLEKWIAKGSIEDNKIWYEGSDTEDEPDDVRFYVGEINVKED